MLSPHTNSSLMNRQTVVFATAHQKERLLAPLFSELGMTMATTEVDTDSLGTFSGEIERTGIVRETLRKKIELARVQKSGERFFLASEGSFSTHPFLGVLQHNLESLLFVDTTFNAEVYAEYFTRDVVNFVCEINSRSDWPSDLERMMLPTHGVIVRPKNAFTPIFKGLHDEHAVAQAILNCLTAGSSTSVIVSSDLRAHHNPTRQRAIIEAGKKLVSSLQVYCPQCGYPGFSIVGTVSGLECEACGQPSSMTKEVIMKCADPHCCFTQQVPRPDGLTALSEADCENCNP